MLSQTNLAHIPHLPWVYIFKDHRGQILYIGKAKNLNKRVHQYFAVWSVWKQDMMHKADSVEFVVVENEWESLMLESNLIKQHQPTYNRLLKWDNSYVYIKITAESRPQIIFTRTRKDDGAVYIGPKHMRNELKKLLQYLRQLLWYRWCKTTQFKQGKLCSDYLFGICKGWCVYDKLSKSGTAVNPWEGKSLRRGKAKSEKLKANNVQKPSAFSLQPSTVNQYLSDAIKLWFPADATFQSGRQTSRHMIQLIVDFFNGETDRILWHITHEIDNCIASQNFEYAAKLRDIYQNMDAMTTKQSVILDPQINGAYCLIQQLGTYRVYCILTIQQGKLVDILRFKESVEETSIEQIQLQFEMEYWSTDSLELIEHNWNYELSTMHCKQQWNNSESTRVGIPVKGELSTLRNQALRFIENFVISDSRQSNSVVNDLLGQLQSRYSLSTYPYRIECIDISHLSWWWASGWLSCVVWGMPDKKLYRQYKIPTQIAGDDLKSLTHVLVNRFKLESGDVLWDDQLPDLFIIDGAAPQLKLINTLATHYPILATYCSKIQFVSIAKGQARSSTSKLYGEAEQLIIRASDGSLTAQSLQHDPIDQIITKVRDEAHRFANRYRTKQMGMELK
jgi:excinuclease ABC subunit C